MIPAGPPIRPASTACTCRVQHNQDGSGSRLFPDPECIVHHGTLVVDLARVPVHGLHDAVAAQAPEQGQGYGQSVQPAQQTRTVLGFVSCPQCGKVLGTHPDVPVDISTLRAAGVELRCDSCNWQGKDWRARPQ